MPAILNVLRETFASQSFVQATNSTAFNIDKVEVMAVQVVATDATPGAKTWVGGTRELQTITYPAKASATAGDYFVITDTSGNTWAAALNVSGSDPAPSGAAYTAVSSGRKVNVDISSATTASDVGGLMRTAVAALSGIASSFNLGGSAATETFQNVNSSASTAPAAFHNANDSGAGSITGVVTTAGVASGVSISAETITITAHGYSLGMPVQVSTAGGLPTGLSASTDYYVIPVDANTIQLASSLANANLGTAINLTTTGYGTGTATPDGLSGSAVLQVAIDSTGPWFNYGNTVNITGAQNIYFEQVNPSGDWYRIAYAMTSGQLSAVVSVLGKGIE